MNSSLRSQRILLFGVCLFALAFAATFVFVLANRGGGIVSDRRNTRLFSASANVQDMVTRGSSTNKEHVVQEVAPDNDRLAQRSAADAKPGQLTTEETWRESTEAYQQELRVEKVEQRGRLLAEGFSPERLDEFQRRKEQLQAQMQQKVYERGQQGLPPTVLSFAVATDADLLLQDEMTDSEYMSYRRAKGLPVDVLVTKVLPGSGAALAGVQSGDQITKYNGKRVFDYRVLNMNSVTGESGDGSGVIEVVRNGISMTLALPKGPTGIEGSEVSQTSALRNRILSRGR